MDGVADTPETPGRRERAQRGPVGGRGSDPADVQIIQRDRRGRSAGARRAVRPVVEARVLTGQTGVRGRGPGGGRRPGGLHRLLAGAGSLRPGEGRVRQLAAHARAPQGGRRGTPRERHPPSHRSRGRGRRRVVGGPGSRRGPGRAGRRRRGSGPRRAGAAARRAARGARPRLLRWLHTTRSRDVDGCAARHRQIPDVHRGAAATQRARPSPG